VRHSLQAIGIDNNLPPYSAISQALDFTTSVGYLVGDQFIFYE